MTTQKSTSELPEITEPLVMAMKAREYQELVNDNKRLLEKYMETNEQLILALAKLQDKDKTIHDLTTESLKAAIKFQDELSKRDTKIVRLCGDVTPFLQDFEARFDKGDDGISPELADDYLRAARFQKALGRTGDRIEEAQEWVNNYLPFERRQTSLSGTKCHQRSIFLR